MTRPNNWHRRGPSDKLRIRGPKWQAIRRRIFERDEWRCIECLKAGKLTPPTQCDHITPLSKGGTNDDTNLQSLCDPCHDAKSEREGVRVARHKPSIGLDGWPTR